MYEIAVHRKQSGIKESSGLEAAVKVKEKVEDGSERAKVVAENEGLPSSSCRPSRTPKVWSEQEDLAFVEAHKALGDNWGAIAERMPGRDRNSIYNRWRFILSRKSKSVLKDYRLRIEVEAEKEGLPSTSFRRSRTPKNWSEQDDLAFVEAHKALGNNWVAIAKRMGRDYESIRSRWKYILSQKSKSVLKDYRQRIEVERAKEKKDVVQN